MMTFKKNNLLMFIHNTVCSDLLEWREQKRNVMQVCEMPTSHLLVHKVIWWDDV